MPLSTKQHTVLVVEKVFSSFLLDDTFCFQFQSRVFIHKRVYVLYTNVLLS